MPEHDVFIKETSGMVLISYVLACDFTNIYGKCHNSNAVKIPEIASHHSVQHQNGDIATIKNCRKSLQECARWSVHPKIQVLS